MGQSCQNGYMQSGLTTAVQRVLRVTPLSLRTLAKEAGVSHTLLGFIARGERQATLAVAGKLLAALEALEQATHGQVAELRQALRASASAPRPRPRRRTRS
jgi:hypothetical protein